MRDYLDGQRADEAFSALCQVLAKGRCVVFVGSGLSAQAGYRPWWNGIYDGFQGSRAQKQGLLSLTALTEKDISSIRDDLPKVAQLCKDSMEPAIFDDFIRAEFGEEGHDHYALPHFVIWATNFQHVITTNFDPCLFRSTNKDLCHDIVSYPTLRLSRDRCLYHLHGRAYVTINDAKQDEPLFIRNLVYTESQYREAYRSESEIEHFLYPIVRDYRLAFVAFSMDDQDFSATMRAVNDQRLVIERKIARERGLTTFESEPHFVFLESPERDHFDNDKAFQDKKAKVDGRRTELEKNGFRIISFFRQDDRYRGLVRALEDLHKAAPYIELPSVKQRTFGLASVDEASSTGY